MGEKRLFCHWQLCKPQIGKMVPETAGRKAGDGFFCVQGNW